MFTALGNTSMEMDPWILVLPLQLLEHLPMHIECQLLFTVRMKNTSFILSDVLCITLIDYHNMILQIAISSSHRYP